MPRVIYKNKEGTRLAGVTTILGILDKPALIQWAWQLGTEGIDWKTVRDKAGGIGTIAHYLCECDLKGVDPEVSVMQEYSPVDVGKAETAFIAYLDFKKNNNLQPIKTELPLVSEKYQFGGCIDCYCKLNNKLTLVDLKTSKGVYPEMICQVSAYKGLLEENGFPVEQVDILQINKETGAFTYHQLPDLTEYWLMFIDLIKVYNRKKKLWKR